MIKFGKRIWGTLLIFVLLLSMGFNVAVVGLASFSSAVAGIYDAVTGSTSAITSVKNRAARSEERLSLVLAEQSKLKTEVSQLSKQLKASEKQAASLSKDLAKGEGRVAALSKDISTKEARIASLSEEVTQFRKVGGVTYRGEKRLLTEAITDTNGRIARRTAQAATRNASSIVAEAIPYLGIAAMLGVTAYDLKDSCDTIKDLHSLDVAIDPSKELRVEDAEVCGLRVPTKDEVWASVKSSSKEAWANAAEFVPNLPEFEMPSWRNFLFWK